MILKLGMKHQGKELYKVYINHDPRMTLDLFYGTVNIKFAYAFEWGKVGSCHLMAENLLGISKVDILFMFTKIFWPQRVACPFLRAIYMYIAVIFTHFRNCLASQSQTSYNWEPKFI